jgi:hypothetical protein
MTTDTLFPQRQGMAQRPVTSSALEKRLCIQIGDSTAAKQEVFFRGGPPGAATNRLLDARAAPGSTQGQKPTSGARCSSRVAGRSPMPVLLYDQTSHLPAAVGTSTSTAFGQNAPTPLRHRDHGSPSIAFVGGASPAGRSQWRRSTSPRPGGASRSPDGQQTARTVNAEDSIARGVCDAQERSGNSQRRQVGVPQPELK